MISSSLPRPGFLPETTSQNSAATSSLENLPPASSEGKGFRGGLSPNTWSVPDRNTRERSTVASSNSPGARDMTSAPDSSQSPSNTIVLPEVASNMMSVFSTASRPDCTACTSMPRTADISSEKRRRLLALRL